MRDLELVSKLKNLGKKLYTVSDLGKILPVKEKSLRTVIMRLTKRGVLNKIARGLYSVFDEAVDIEEAACQLYYPSYLSLKTVLSKQGIINQIPQEVQLITARKSYKIKIAGVLVVYRQIKKELFFGYFKEKRKLIAYPEKALLDLLYFALLGKEYFPAKEIDVSKIDKVRWRKYRRYYPEKIERLISAAEERIG